MNVIKPSNTPAPDRSSSRSPSRRSTRLGVGVEQHKEVAQSQLQLQKPRSNPGVTPERRQRLDEQERLRAKWQVELGKLLKDGGLCVHTTEKKVTYANRPNFPHFLENCNIRPNIYVKLPSKSRIPLFHSTKKVQSTWVGETVEVAVYRALIGVAFDYMQHLETEKKELLRQYHGLNVLKNKKVHIANTTTPSLDRDVRAEMREIHSKIKELDSSRQTAEKLREECCGSMTNLRNSASSWSTGMECDFTIAI